MRKIILAIILLSAFLSRVAHGTTCNENGRLDDYLYEWLSSSTDTLALARQQYAKWASDDSGRQAIVDAYTSYFGQRAAPIAEIGYCTSVELSGRVNYALSRFQ